MTAEVMLSKELTEAAYYTRYHYFSERLYCPRALEEVLDRVEALTQEAEPEAAALPLLPALLAFRPRLPQPLPERLEAIYDRLASLALMASLAQATRPSEATL